MCAEFAARVISVVAMVDHVVSTSTSDTSSKSVKSTLRIMKMVMMHVMVMLLVRVRGEMRKLMVMGVGVVVPSSHKRAGLGLTVKGDHIVIWRILAEVCSHVEECCQLRQGKGKQEKVKGETILVLVKGYQSLLMVGVGQVRFKFRTNL